MSRIFQFVPKANVKRSKFDLSHARKLSMRLGALTPVLVQEVVPGDKFDIQTESMIRLAPMVAPIMHRMNASIHYFFVPTRIIWEHFEDFITGKEKITTPQISLNRRVDGGGLADHMGIPVWDYTGSSTTINALPFRAYDKIFNDYYRDQSLQDEIELGIVRDNQYLNSYLHYRAWEKDYFTSALPTPQLGNVPVTVGADVLYKEVSNVLKDDGTNPVASNLKSGISNGKSLLYTEVGGNTSRARIENVEDIILNVEDLRLATRLQRFLERSMRSGNRYFEHLLAHWGVMSKDARLQRAEYIGGGMAPVVISEVQNTTGTEDAVQGQLAGNGISIGNSNIASKYCEEHGYIIGIMSVLPTTAYSQGIHRMYDRKLQLDFYFPEFANLGEQEVKNQEIYATANTVDNEKTFGYQSRFAEYKYAPSTVHGDFRKALEFWHMGRKFAGLPLLNEEFIKADKIDDGLDPWRIFAVPSEEHLYVQLWHNIYAVRPMPFLSEPTL